MDGNCKIVMLTMDWLVTNNYLCVVRKCLLIAAIIAYGQIQITRSSDVKIDKTFYYSMPVRDAADYRSVSLLESTISPQTKLVTWEFTALALSITTCRHRDVVIRIQHGGFALLNTDSKKYPANFYLHRTSVQTLVMSSNDRHRVVTLANPLPGTWFIAAYLAHIDDRPMDCVYTLQLNVTSLVTTSVQQLLADDVKDLTLHQNTTTFKIFCGDTTWRFTVIVSDCAVNGSHVDHCPLVLSVRSGALPGNHLDSVTVNCTINKCIVYAVNPLVGQWLYIKLDSLVTESVTARLKANTEECGHTSDDIMPDNTTLPVNTSSACPAVYTLRRIENPNIRFSVEYNFDPTSDKMLMLLLNGYVTILQFDVAPMKDTGGTLTLQAALELLLNTWTQKIVVHICLQRGVIPIYDGDLKCAAQDFMELSSWANKSVVRHFPYPESGPWFLGLQGWCLPLNESSISKAEPCRQAAISFSLRTSSCINMSCANTGKCYLARRGPYVLSTCKCYAGWRGYGCTDGSHVRSLALQITYTLLLTLTNLAFIPAIILSIYRRYPVEALVYTANMVFSGLYHACDVNSWSVYNTCVLSYNVLSHCDFFTSILSFVVTLTAMAKLPRTLTSLVHMVNILFLVLAVEWDQHNLMTFLVPTVFCLLIVIAAKGHRLCRKRQCHRREWCFMGPGVVLAVVGMCLFAFVETHENYPLVHSMWHICMALCIIFLLPRSNSSTTKKETLSEFALSDTPMSSDDASLLPADSLAVQPSDVKDDIIL